MKLKFVGQLAVPLLLALVAGTAAAAVVTPTEVVVVAQADTNLVADAANARTPPRRPPRIPPSRR